MRNGYCLEIRILARARFLDVNKIFMSPKQDQEGKDFSSYDIFPLDIKMRSVGGQTLEFLHQRREGFFPGHDHAMKLKDHASRMCSRQNKNKNQYQKTQPVSSWLWALWKTKVQSQVLVFSLSQNQTWRQKKYQNIQIAKGSSGSQGVPTHSTRRASCLSPPPVERLYWLVRQKLY